MRAVRAEVLELVFAAAVVAVFASAAAAVVDRVSRRTLLLLTGVISAVALAACGITVCAALEGATLVLQRLLARARRLDDQLEEAEARFAAVASAEADARAAELERTLARARADSLSKLVAE